MISIPNNDIKAISSWESRALISTLKELSNGIL